MSDTKAQLAEAGEKIQGQETELGHLKALKSDAEERIKTLGDNFATCQTDFSDTSSSLSTEKATNSAHGATIVRLEAEVVFLKGQNTEITAKYDDCTKQKGEVDTKFSACAAQKTELENTRDLLKGQVTTLTTENNELGGKHTTCVAAKNTLTIEKGNLEQEKTANTAEITKLEGEVDTLETTAENLKADLRALRKSFDYQAAGITKANGSETVCVVSEGSIFNSNLCGKLKEKLPEWAVPATVSGYTQ